MQRQWPMALVIRAATVVHSPIDDTRRWNHYDSSQLGEDTF